MEKKLIKQFIKELIENNDYYEHINNEYTRNEDKEYYIDKIYSLFYGFDAYYSIYTIMNSIEDKMRDLGRNFEDTINNENFEIRDW